MIDRRHRLRLMALGWALVVSVGRGGAATAPAAAPPGARVTAVAGPSWRKHLRLPYGDSAMGQVGSWGAAEGAVVLPHFVQAPVGIKSDDRFLLTGADLYRVSCQACHTQQGTGASTEILSLIGPVQASLPGFIRSRLEARGLAVDTGQIKQLAAQSQQAIRDRLHNGGQRMPAFPYLTVAEETALLAYVRRLAGAPEPEGALVPIRETPDRTGELLVKGTCHVCHDAQGPDVTPETWQPRFDTLIPSLTAVSRQRTITGFVRKVREGLPGTDLPTPVRGKMPQFSYLTEDEITAAYCYLLSHPPLP